MFSGFISLLPEVLSFLVTSASFGVNWHDSHSKPRLISLNTYIGAQLPNIKLENVVFSCLDWEEKQKLHPEGCFMFPGVLATVAVSFSTGRVSSGLIYVSLQPSISSTDFLHPFQFCMTVPEGAREFSTECASKLPSSAATFLYKETTFLEHLLVLTL